MLRLISSPSLEQTLIARDTRTVYRFLARFHPLIKYFSGLVNTILLFSLNRRIVETRGGDLTKREHRVRFTNANEETTLLFDYVAVLFLFCSLIIRSINWRTLFHFVISFQPNLIMFVRRSHDNNFIKVFDALDYRYFQLIVKRRKIQRQICPLKWSFMSSRGWQSVFYVQSRHRGYF